MINKEYITFVDNSRGKVVSHGTIWVNESFVLKDVALVFNLMLIWFSIYILIYFRLQFLEDGYEVCFKKGRSHVLDGKETLFLGFPCLD
jgi:hypothetical protein